MRSACIHSAHTHTHCLNLEMKREKLDFVFNERVRMFNVGKCKSNKFASKQFEKCYQDNNDDGTQTCSTVWYDQSDRVSIKQRFICRSVSLESF